MGEPVYDVIVVGAGIEGSASALQLSRRHGIRVLLLEQFPLPHTRGSSHGASRILRKCHPEKYYTDMMEFGFKEWERIQREAGETLYRKTGYLIIGSPEHEEVKSYLASMKQNNSAHEVISPDDFRKRYPNLSYGPEAGAIVDFEGGIIYSHRALQTFQKLFVKRGGEIRDGEKVVTIKPGETIHVVTSKQTYKCRSLIVCCGPWSKQVARGLGLDLPLKTVKISVCYWPEKVQGSYSEPNMLTFIDFMKNCEEAPHDMYGLPSDEYPGHFKLCLHIGPEVDPELRDTRDSQWVIDILKTYVKTHFPGLQPEPSIVEPCFYTKTPDDNFILDTHPHWKNIVIGAGFSGHGFKFAPVVGDILADLALGVTPKFDLSDLKVDRFNTSQTSRL